MTTEEAAQAEVNAAASKAKRDAHLATVPPEELAQIKADMGISEPSSAFAAIQQEEKDYQANRKKKKKGTVATAIQRDPVTGLPIAGSIKAPAGSEGATFTVFDPMSGQVESFDDFEKASMFADTYGQEVKTVPKASVSGAGNNLQASQQMSSGTSKMNAGNADLAQSGGGGAVAVNAPTTTTNVQNNTHRGAMPTAMDKSDRTDRRGRNRGTG
jgi:hypothetical protein